MQYIIELDGYGAMARTMYLIHFGPPYDGLQQCIEYISSMGRRRLKCIAAKWAAKGTLEDVYAYAYAYAYEYVYAYAYVHV